MPVRAWVWSAPMCGGHAIVSSVRVTFSPRHAHLQVWNRGGYAGELTVERQDWSSFVCMLGFDLDPAVAQQIDDAARVM